MRRIDIDFVEQKSAVRPAIVVLLVVAIAAAAYGGKSYFELSTKLKESKEKLKSAQIEQRNAAPVQTQNSGGAAKLQAELNAALRVQSRLTMPWDALFKEIELSINDQTSLLSVEPDPEKGELRITAEAKDLQAMLDYEKRLQAKPLFLNVHIQNHQIQIQDAQRPVRFLVQAGWNLKAPATSGITVPELIAARP